MQQVVSRVESVERREKGRVREWREERVTGTERGKASAAE